MYKVSTQDSRTTNAIVAHRYRSIFAHTQMQSEEVPAEVHLTQQSFRSVGATHELIAPPPKKYVTLIWPTDSPLRTMIPRTTTYASIVAPYCVSLAKDELCSLHGSVLHVHQIGPLPDTTIPLEHCAVTGKRPKIKTRTIYNIQSAMRLMFDDDGLETSLQGKLIILFKAGTAMALRPLQHPQMAFLCSIYMSTHPRDSLDFSTIVRPPNGLYKQQRHMPVYPRDSPDFWPILALPNGLLQLHLHMSTHPRDSLDFSTIVTPPNGLYEQQRHICLHPRDSLGCVPIATPRDGLLQQHSHTCPYSRDSLALWPISTLPNGLLKQ